MKDNTVPGVYLLNIDMGCEQAKEEFKRMGFTDGEKLDFQRFTPQALSVTPLWLVWHGTIHNGNMLLKSDEGGCVKTKAHLLFYLKIVVPLFFVYATIFSVIR